MSCAASNHSGTTTISADVGNEAWDEFLSKTASVHFEQTSGWGMVKSSYGWRVLRLMAQNQGELVGGIQVLTRRIGRLGTVGYVCRGPVLAAANETVAHDLIESLEHIARKNHWLYLVFDHAYNAHDLATRLARKGYIHHPPQLPPSGLMDATILIDITKPEEELLGQMRKRCRRQINTALHSSLSFDTGNEGDLPVLRQLMEVLCARRGASPTPPQPDYFNRLWFQLNHKGWVKVFLVRKAEKIICAVFAFTIGDTIRVWKVGWSGEHSEECPNYLLYWGVIRWAKSNGFKTFDFVQIDAADAKLIASGESDPAKFKVSTSLFKAGFGGSFVFLPPVQSNFFHPVLRAVNKVGGMDFLNTRFCRAMMSRFWSATVARSA